jgi:hypothetical protein
MVEIIGSIKLKLEQQSTACISLIYNLSNISKNTHASAFKYQDMIFMLKNNCLILIKVRRKNLTITKQERETK